MRSPKTQKSMTYKKTVILYIGNMMAVHGKTPTTIETLAPRLALDFEMITVSEKANKFLRLLDMWFALIKYRKRIKFVLIDTYSTSAYFYAKTCGFLCRKLNLSYIPFLHGGGLPTKFVSDFSASKEYLQGARVIVSPSGYLQDAVAKQFALQATVIPNFIDIQIYPFLIRSALNPLRIFWLRSLHKTYQPHLAVEVLHHLVGSGLDAQLTIVGPEKDDSGAYCKQLAKDLGLQDKITFTDRLDKATWIALSATHNLFLNTSAVDNTPVSIMEAMALGMPVVTTKVGGIPYLFEDGKEGIMVENQEAKVMAAAILDLVKSPEQAENLSLAARKKAESWDWEVIRQMWINVLNG